MTCDRKNLAGLCFETLLKPLARAGETVLAPEFRSALAARERLARGLLRSMRARSACCMRIRIPLASNMVFLSAVAIWLCGCGASRKFDRGKPGASPFAVVRSSSRKEAMIKILTDSVASIPADMAKAAGVEVITLFVNRAGVEYADATMDLDEFYAGIYDMVDDIPTSSQPSQLTLERAFEEAALDGDDVLGIFISTGLSGTYEGAVRAARAVKARNIHFSYVMIDSASCGFDEAWPVLDAVAARDAGEDLAGCAAAALFRHRVHALSVHAGDLDVSAERRPHRQRGGSFGEF